jgi:hypothetical protein
MFGLSQVYNAIIHNSFKEKFNHRKLCLTTLLVLLVREIAYWDKIIDIG